jgi:hypothetical protein
MVEYWNDGFELNFQYSSIPVIQSVEKDWDVE